jgi:hypothetical protein
LRRLKKIETYIANRHAQRLRNLPSVFSSPRIDALAMTIFEESEDLRNMQTRLEIENRIRHEEKLAEWQSKTQAYENLLEEAKTIHHRKTASKTGEQIHKKKNCRKCRIEADIAALNIEVGESSLPTTGILQKFIIFEIMCSVGITA